MHWSVEVKEHVVGTHWRTVDTYLFDIEQHAKSCKKQMEGVGMLCTIRKEKGEITDA